MSFPEAGPMVGPGVVNVIANLLDPAGVAMASTEVDQPEATRPGVVSRGHGLDVISRI